MSWVQKILKTTGVYLVLLVFFLGAIGFGAFQKYRFRDHEIELRSLLDQELEILRRQNSVYGFSVVSPWISRSQSIEHYFVSSMMSGAPAHQVLKNSWILSSYYPDLNSSRDNLIASYRSDLLDLDIEEREVNGPLWADTKDIAIAFAREHLSRAEGWLRSGLSQYALIHLLAALRLSRAAIGAYSGGNKTGEAYFISGRAIDLLFGRRTIIRELLNLGTRSVWSVQAGKLYQGYFQR